MRKRSDIYLREEIKGYSRLEELALDFAWSWKYNHGADTIWNELDRDLWELMKNPWSVLQTVSREKLEKKLSEKGFSSLLEDLVTKHHQEMRNPAWFQKKHADAHLSSVAYFSLEYMLFESLPIYSGGLGNVAGDQLKAASDLGVPIVALGLLYQRGYFRQVIDKEGMQHALYPYNDPGQLPLMPLRKPNGEWIRLELGFPGWQLTLRAWEARVGRVRLYLLDSNDVVNYPAFRGITSELYGGDAELRLQQEIILGIGGWKLLQLLGLKPDVCHLNEGHAAFAILERAKDFMQLHNVPFDVALQATRAGNLFTTHTAVPAGFDRYSQPLMEQYLSKFAEEINIPMKEFMALGRRNPNDEKEDFNMAYLALRGSSASNGVSLLHGRVSRQIFEPLFARWPESEVPVSHVTNGVHMPTWNSEETGSLWKEYCGSYEFHGTVETLEKDFKKVPDHRIWKLRNDARKKLVNFVRGRLARIWEMRGFPPQEVDRAKSIFDPNMLTLGFARRFATYKRPTMLLHDVERLLRILSHPQRPAQLIIAGKAHPADKVAQEMIRQWISLFHREEARAHVIFLADDDMIVRQNLVRGVDLWINTPRRPWEACGTSGMKILGNGGLNVSELDGWWAEAYCPEVGWALGDGQEHSDHPSWDAQEANALYTILENEVAPEFYTRDDKGIPTKWVERMRKSMSELTPRYSADRTVREYTESYYLPAAKAYHSRTAKGAELAKKMVEWRRALESNWHLLRFLERKADTSGDHHTIEVSVYLDDLNPDFVHVELYVENPSQKFVMKKLRDLPNSTYVFSADVPSSRPATEYTPRIVPYFEGVNVPLEAPQILWYS